MTDSDKDLLRRYFRGERFQASATLEQRIMHALAHGRQARPGPWLRRPATRAVVAIAALVIVAGCAALPVAATTTPLAPGARQMLSAVGMSPVVEHLMTTQSQATVAGHTVKLVGVLATGSRTVVILKITPSAPPRAPRCRINRGGCLRRTTLCCSSHPYRVRARRAGR
jgi:hypothetical protein